MRVRCLHRLKLRRPPRALRGAASAALACRAAVLLFLVPGCRIDIVRTRSGNSIDREKVEKLEVRKTTRAEALDLLGAPERVEWKNGDDYFWYLYGDALNASVRFQFPPPPLGSIFGYRHNFLVLNENAQDVNSLALVFDELGIVEQKSLRLPKAYSPPPEDMDGWKFHLTPHFEHSIFLSGDGGIEDYDQIFQNGFRTGLDAGWQPFPVFTLTGHFDYQEYQGDDLRSGGARLTFDDLRLYQFEIGIRLAAPLDLLVNFGDFDRVRRVLFEEDLSRSQGWRLYIAAATGAAFNSDVAVKSDAVPSGNLYDDGFGFSGSIGAGVEYGWKWGAAYAGVTYQSIDAFDEGNSPFEDEGSSMQALLIGGGVGVKF